MERAKFRLIAGFFALLTITASASTPETKIYNAYISGNMAQWKSVIDSMQMHKPLMDHERLELLNFQYGYIGWLLGNKRKKEATDYLSKAQKNRQLLENENYHLSTLLAYRAAFIGFEVALKPIRAPFTGPKAHEYIAKAAQLNNQDYFVYLQEANIAQHTPDILGGSAADAIRYFEKAIGLYREQKRPLKSWNFLNLYSQLILACIEDKDYAKATACCHKILRIEPGFSWIKNAVLPELQSGAN